MWNGYGSNNIEMHFKTLKFEQPAMRKYESSNQTNYNMSHICFRREFSQNKIKIRNIQL